MVITDHLTSWMKLEFICWSLWCGESSEVQVLSKHVICEAPGGGNMRGNRQDWRGAGRSYEGDTGGVVECS